MIKQFKQASDWSQNTGVGVKASDQDSFEQYIRKVCLHWDDLQEVLGDQALARPAFNSDDLVSVGHSDLDVYSDGDSGICTDCKREAVMVRYPDEDTDEETDLEDHQDENTQNTNVKKKAAAVPNIRRSFRLGEQPRQMLACIVVVGLVGNSIILVELFMQHSNSICYKDYNCRYFQFTEDATILTKYISTAMVAAGASAFVALLKTSSSYAMTPPARFRNDDKTYQSFSYAVSPTRYWEGEKHLEGTWLI
jgi:hypothetical protein